MSSIAFLRPRAICNCRKRNSCYTQEAALSLSLSLSLSTGIPRFPVRVDCLSAVSKTGYGSEMTNPWRKSSERIQKKKRIKTPIKNLNFCQSKRSRWWEEEIDQQPRFSTHQKENPANFRRERWNRRHESPLQLLTCPDANRTASPVTVTTDSLKMSLVLWSTVKLVWWKNNQVNLPISVDSTNLTVC